MKKQDTIAAIATPAGAGGIAVIRISGGDAIAVADRIFRAADKRALAAKKGYTAAYGRIMRNGEAVDDGVALIFRAPHSYTGEDTVELSCHGGELIAAETLRAALEAGARAAGAGEFTRRAFMNGKLSLTQAEAVADLVSAVSAQGARAARAAATGALQRDIDAIKERLLSSLAHITAFIDFPEEDVEATTFDALKADAEALYKKSERLLSGERVYSAVVRGVPCAIVGSPNVGKSTLLNLLAGSERAIVTPIAGTTRDIVEERVTIGGTVLLLRDTAGLRETDSEIERLGVERTRREIESAALILAVFDGSSPLADSDRELIASLSQKTAIAVVNKTDLPSETDRAFIESSFETVVYISSKEKSSVVALDRAIAKKLSTETLDPSSALVANERQRECVRGIQKALSRALILINAREALDAVSLDLEEALSYCMALSGEEVSTAVLDRVFESFCVGK